MVLSIASCGENNTSKPITKTDLAGKTFEYSDIEIAWSANATDAQKNSIKSEYGETNETKLFAKIKDTYKAILTVFGSSYMVLKLEFNESNDYSVNIYKGKTLDKTVQYSIGNNSLNIDNVKYVYKDGALRNTENSEDLPGIAITVVYTITD